MVKEIPQLHKSFPQRLVFQSTENPSQTGHFIFHPIPNHFCYYGHPAFSSHSQEDYKPA